MRKKSEIETLHDRIEVLEYDLERLTEALRVSPEPANTLHERRLRMATELGNYWAASVGKSILDT